MSLRTPLAQVLHHGSARGGVGHWWLQRVTAVALAPLCVWLTVALLCLPGGSYGAVTAWIAAGLHPVLLCLIALLAPWHAWLGLQVIIEDYVAQAGSKLLLLLASAFANGLLAACGVYAVLRIALRGSA